MIEMKPYVTNNLILGNCVNVVIGISGLLSGQILVGLTQELAMYIGTKMLGNMVVTLDEQVKSSVLELCKLIIGNSCVTLFHSGVSVRITSISVISGESIEYSSIGQEIICVPFEAQYGKMLIYLHISNSENKYMDD